MIRLTVVSLPDPFGISHRAAVLVVQEVVPHIVAPSLVVGVRFAMLKDVPNTVRLVPAEPAVFTCATNDTVGVS